jgi:hypothetical protein
MNPSSITPVQRIDDVGARVVPSWICIPVRVENIWRDAKREIANCEMISTASGGAQRPIVHVAPLNGAGVQTLVRFSDAAAGLTPRDALPVATNKPAARPAALR